MAAGLPDEVAWHFLRRRRTSVRVQTVAQKRCQMVAKNRLVLSCLIISLFVLLSLTTISLPAYATTYYVDASGGNDFNDGLSPETAWKTISKVNSMDFKPGDTILFKRGEIWREQLIVPSSGEEGRPITFGAYGEGEKPKITGADVIRDWSGPDGNGEYTKTGLGNTRVFFEDGVRLNRGIHGTLAPGEWDYARGTLYWRPSDDVLEGHVTEAGQRDGCLYIENKSYINLEDLIFSGGNNRNTIEASGGGVEIVSCSHIYIKNCVFRNNYFYGIGISESSNIEIVNCEGSYNHGSAINITKSSNCTIYGGRYHHNSPLYSDATGGADTNGIEVTGGSFNINIIAVEVDHNGLGIAGNPKGNNADAGIAFYDASGIIKYCRIHHNGGGGCYFYTDNAMNVTGEFSYNLVYRNNQNNEPNGAGGIRISGKPGQPCSVNIYNNVIAYNRLVDSSWNAIRIGWYCENCQIKNNIIAFNSGNPEDVYISGTGTTGIELDYNLYFDISGNFITYKGKTYDIDHIMGNLPGYYSYDQHQDINSIVQDPLFVDPANDDFHLQSTSPCINAGTDVGLAEDMEGNPVDYAPDIGAYEYSDNPIPDIKVNGSDGPITLNQSDRLTITIALENNGRTDNAKWWLAADTPFDFLFFTSKGWIDKQQPLYQRPLFYLEPYEVFSIDTSQLSAGTYILYFCIDTNMDSDTIWDSPYCDSVIVNVTE